MISILLSNLLFSCKEKGCTETRDDLYNPESIEHDDSECDPAGTLYKFLGNFSVSETCLSASNGYTLRIDDPDLENYTVKIYYIYDTNGQFVLDGRIVRDSLFIDSQLISGVTFQGSGRAYGNSLTLNYSLDNGSATDNCSLTGTK